MFRYLIVAALGLGAFSYADMDVGSIDEFIVQEMADSGVPGVAYAVVEDGEVVASAARGVAEAGADQEVTPDTPFVIGSVSKSFTALAVMQLVEAGEVDLEGALSDYLEGFAGGPAGDVTIRQLLSHTSGYSTVQGNASHTDDTGGTDELEMRVAALEEVEPAYAPGERWEYSNTNYEILGRVIEVVSGEAFQSYVEAHILEPIGMENSFVADGEAHESMATGHVPWFFTNRPLSDKTTHRGTAPQGGVVASVNDLALYMITMMNGEDDVLSAEGKARMMEPAVGSYPWYGFGWSLDSSDGTVWHSGATPGFESLATMIPSESKGVVVLVNGGSGVGFGETTDLRVGVTALALDLDYVDGGSRWLQKALFLSLALLPLFYLASMVWAWTHRDQIRAKRTQGAFGVFSLWFPLLTTLAAAVVILWLVPSIIGAPLSTISLFQPDFSLALTATAVMGVAWALFRLGVGYVGE